MIETWLEHAHPGIYMRATIFWGWVALLAWMPIAMMVIGATEAWHFFQEQVNGMYRMTNLRLLEFSWEGSDNPNDPSGVACFKVGRESVKVLMQDLPQALALSRLIEKACDWQKQQVIDRAISGLTDILDQYRYD